MPLISEGIIVISLGKRKKSQCLVSSDRDQYVSAVPVSCSSSVRNDNSTASWRNLVLAYPGAIFFCWILAPRHQGGASKIVLHLPCTTYFFILQVGMQSLSCSAGRVENEYQIHALVYSVMLASLPGNRWWSIPSTIFSQQHPPREKLF